VTRSPIELHHVVEAAGVVAFGVLFYSYSQHWLPAGTRRGRLRGVLNGLVFGALAVWLMRARIQIADGIFIDARSIPIAVVTLAEGWPAGVVAVVPAMVYRWWLGGAGAAAGIAGLAGVLAVGWLANRWAHRDGGIRWRHGFGLGATVFLVTLGSFALLGGRGLRQFETLWLGYVSVYAVGIGLVVQLFRDVGERAHLAIETARFRAVLDEASDAIRIEDAERGTILDVNRADAALTGYPREHLVGRHTRELWPEDPALRAEHGRELAEVAERGFAQRFGVSYRTQSGGIVQADSTRRRVAHGGRLYDIVVLRRSAEREAVEAARREASELRAVTLLARATAHEINNPLAAVMGLLDLLGRRVPDGSKEHGFVDRAIEASGRIRDIVARMNHITRIEADRGTERVPAILDLRRSSELPGEPGVRR
jgi:PAS domain S-box-containing protein